MTIREEIIEAYRNVILGKNTAGDPSNNFGIGNGWIKSR